MKDLVDFQYHRINALQSRVAELERLVLEVTDEDCPNAFREIVRTEILKQ